MCTTLLCNRLTFQLLELVLCVVVDLPIDSVAQHAWDEGPHFLLYLVLEQIEDEGDAAMDVDVHTSNAATAATGLDGRSARGVDTCRHKVNQ